MTLFEARDVTKRFAGITALDGVSVEIEPGEFVGLIGPNGAGKTTLFNCLYGLLKPDRGRVLLDGNDITRLPTYRRAAGGERVRILAQDEPVGEEEAQARRDLIRKVREELLFLAEVVEITFLHEDLPRGVVAGEQAIVLAL